MNQKKGVPVKIWRNSLLPSVPLTGLLWHLRMVTSSLPSFLFIENKIYKVIHTFFFFFFFSFVCFLLTLKIGNIQNTLFTPLHSFIIYRYVQEKCKSSF